MHAPIVATGVRIITPIIRWSPIFGRAADRSNARADAMALGPEVGFRRGGRSPNEPGRWDRRRPTPPGRRAARGRPPPPGPSPRGHGDGTRTLGPIVSGGRGPPQGAAPGNGAVGPRPRHLFPLGVRVAVRRGKARIFSGCNPRPDNSASGNPSDERRPIVALPVFRLGSTIPSAGRCEG